MPLLANRPLLETKVMRRRLIELRGRCRVTSVCGRDLAPPGRSIREAATAESKVLYRSGEELKALAVSSRRLVVVVDRLRESKKAFMGGGVVGSFAQEAANMAACKTNMQRSHADYPTLIFRRPWSTSPFGL